MMPTFNGMVNTLRLGTGAGGLSVVELVPEDWLR